MPRGMLDWMEERFRYFYVLQYTGQFNKAKSYQFSL